VNEEIWTSNTRENLLFGLLFDVLSELAGQIGGVVASQRMRTGKENACFAGKTEGEEGEGSGKNCQILAKRWRSLPPPNSETLDEKNNVISI